MERGGRCCVGIVVRGCGAGCQESSGLEQLGLDVASGEQAVVADADEASGQDVQEEAPNELDGIEGKGLVLSVVGVVGAFFRPVGANLAAIR